MKQCTTITTGTMQPEKFDADLWFTVLNSTRSVDEQKLQPIAVSKSEL